MENSESDCVHRTNAGVATRGAVHELCELVIVIVLDDFGTGMPTLSRPRQFPIAVDEIARTFVAGVGEEFGPVPDRVAASATVRP